MTETISVHHYPHPRVRRIVTRLIAVALVAVAGAFALQVILALTMGPLFCGTAGFTAILVIPRYPAGAANRAAS
jgi:hypothetical protein